MFVRMKNMNSVSIRPVKPGDAEVLLPLLDQQYQHHSGLNPGFYRKPSPNLRKDLQDFFNTVFSKKRFGGFVAVIDKKIVGLVTYAFVQRGYLDTVPQNFLEVIEL